MVVLKEQYCTVDGSSSNYGDDLRCTLKPSFCSCNNNDCTINVLVHKYKAEITQFEKYYPGKMFYPMLI